MTDPTTGVSRGMSLSFRVIFYLILILPYNTYSSLSALNSLGYGFVRFTDESEQMRALHEMQGVYCGSRAIRISMATPKNKMGVNSNTNNMNNPSGGNMAIGGMGGMGNININNNMGMSPTGYGFPAVQSGSPQHPSNQYNDPNNTTVFVGGLSGVSHEDELRNCFAMFGDITYVKIPPGKGCGFVQFVHRQSAEMAINQMNGYQIGKGTFLINFVSVWKQDKPSSNTVSL